ncbi:hypothetical protein D3C78_1757600 [compost metagenome]
MLDHCPGNHLGTGSQLALQTDQLFFQQCQCLWHPDQHPVERPREGFAGRYVGHGVKRLAIADQILFQPLQGQE